MTYADATTAYVTGQSTDNLIRVNLTTGTPATVTNISGSSLTGVALIDPSTAYLATIVANNIYRANLTNGTFSQVNQFSVTGAGLDRIQLANSATAYTTGATTSTIYRANLTSGDVSLITSITGAGLIGIALEMSLTTPTIAYVTGATNGSVHRVDLTNGNVSQIASISGGHPFGITLANNTTAYVVDRISNIIYRVNLTNGNVSQVTTITGASLQGISLANNTTAYTVGLSGNIYSVDLTTGNFSQVAGPLGSTLIDIGLVLQIGTSGLSGNNVRFANYLNAHASQITLPLLALQSDIASALEIAAPTRNAIFTFAAQTTQLAFGQQVYDHLSQKRWRKAWQQQSMQTSQNRQNRFFADASDSMNPSSESLSESAVSHSNFSTRKNQFHRQSKMICKKEAHYFPWLGVFGEYTHERSQHQTPSFETGTGGFVLATDYHRGSQPAPLLGGGVAYAYTHVHEDDEAGHANINQGAAIIYGAWAEPKWYVNWALWGGYYHAHNVRNISLPGVIGGRASSSTHGWQLTPHFEVGYDHGSDWFCVEPFDMIDWVACWEDGFQEHGAGKLNMGQKDRFCSLLRNEAGVRFAETLLYSWGTITFLEKGSYVYQKAFHTGVIRAFLVGSAGSFVVSTLTGAQNLGAIEFESLFVPVDKKLPYGTISYQGEFGSRYQSHQGMITIGKDF